MALPSNPAILEVGDGAVSENFTPIFEVGDISGPELTQNVHEVTAHGQEWIDRVNGMKDIGTLTFPVYFLPTHATHSAAQGLIKLLTDGTKRNFRMKHPDTGETSWILPCFVTTTAIESPADGVHMCNITLTGAGAPTLA